jgi:hypothetical protein
MIRALLRSSIAITVAIFAARQAIFAARDLARYNSMSEMSGDPPLLSQSKKPAATNAGALQTNPLLLITSAYADLSRYLRLRSM